MKFYFFKFVIAFSIIGSTVTCNTASVNVNNSMLGSNAEITITPITTWPPLPTRGFIKGRAATKKDVEDGNAVFVAAIAGKGIGIPINIDIPQFGIWNDSESGRKIKVIVLQAEKAQKRDLIGFMNIETGEFRAGLKEEFQFLGTRP